MAGVKISQLPVYPAPISPGDLLPIVSNSSGILTTYHVSAVNFVVSPVLNISNTFTIPWTDPAEVTVTNIAPAEYNLSFSIPQGPPGLAGVITSVSAVNDPVLSVTNLGTTNNAKLLFKFPVAPAGPQGPKGDRGIDGDWSTPQVVKYLSGSGYMPTSADAGALLIIESDTPSVASFVLSAPTSAIGGFTVGQKVDVIKTGTSPVSCTAFSGATISGTPSLRFRDQYSSAALIYYKPNAWVVIGDLAIP